MKRGLLFLLLLPALRGFSQYDPLQSQYVLNRIVINPAYTGADGFLSTTLSYRKQWWGIDGAPETFAFTAHTPLRNQHFNMGLVVSQDNLAVLHQSRAQLLYAYRIFAGRNFSMSVGISPGVSFSQSNWAEVKTNSPDVNFQNNQNELAYESGYGIYLATKRFFFGASSTVRYVSGKPFSPTSQPVLVYTGYTFGDKENFAVTVSALGRYLLNYDFQADANLMAYIRNRVGIGVSYRIADAAIGLLEIRVNDQFRIGYSYEYTLSHLQEFSSGSHELVLRYDFDFHLNPKSPRNF